MRTGEVDRWGGCLRAPLNAPRVWVLRSQDSGTGAPRDSSPGPWGSLNNGVQAAQSRSPELPQRPPRNQVANVTLDAGRSGPFPDRSEPAPFPRHLSYFLPPARFPPAPAPPPGPACWTLDHSLRGRPLAVPAARGGTRGSAVYSPPPPGFAGPEPSPPFGS